MRPFPPHVWGETQVPQLATDRELSQLSQSTTGPQSFPTRPQNSLSVSGLHVPEPHTFATGGFPQPHFKGAVQLPQLRVVPQPSDMAPQF